MSWPRLNLVDEVSAESGSDRVASYEGGRDLQSVDIREPSSQTEGTSDQEGSIPSMDGDRKHFVEVP